MLEDDNDSSSGEFGFCDTCYGMQGFRVFKRGKGPIEARLGALQGTLMIMADLAESTLSGISTHVRFPPSGRVKSGEMMSEGQVRVVKTLKRSIPCVRWNKDQADRIGRRRCNKWRARFTYRRCRSIAANSPRPTS